MPQDWLSWIFLIVLVGALISYAGFVYHRSNYRPLQWVLLFGCILLTRFLWRLSIPRRLPIPDHTGAVLVSNHRSSIDPFYFQTIARRPVHWMVAREFCEHPYFRWFLAQTEAIPTGRGGIDAAATRTAIRYASSGEPVGMFPEGRINVTSEFMLPVRPGAIMVALRARVPVIPCYIEGSPYGGTAWSPIVTPARVKVRFGPPIYLNAYYDRDDSNAVREACLLVVREIAKLAGRTDFEPQLAGRAWKPEASELDSSREEN